MTHYIHVLLLVYLFTFVHTSPPHPTLKICYFFHSPTEEVPLEAQLFVTAALRNLSACSAALLLFRALVPSQHPWHSPFLAGFLSLSVWNEVAATSYCSYLVHFRLLMEIIYSAPLRDLIGLTIPAVTLAASGASSLDELVQEWLVLMMKVFLVGTGVSLFVGKVLHELVEKPAGKVVEKYLFSKKHSTQLKKRK
jgi:hypothetical protein